MREVKTEKNILEEEYLDCLIKLAYDMDDMDKEQQIMAEAEDDELAPDEFTVRRTWQMAQEKMNRLEQEEKKKKRISAVRRAVPQVMKIAACLLLAVCIGVPVVIASSAEIRSRVIRMLLNIDPESNVAYFDFAEDPEQGFAVPADWLGQYFISSVPAGMEMVSCNPDAVTVEFADPEGENGVKRGFEFAELSEAEGSVAGTKGASMKAVDINGREGSLFEYPERGSVAVMWQNDEKMFTLNCWNMTADEALAVARSVRKIIQ